MSRRILVAASLAVLLLAPFAVSQFWLNMLVLSLIYSLAVFSINVLTGYAGLLSFGQAGFVGAGAYTYGVLSVMHVPVVACIAAGLALPTALGLVLALPAARLKGPYLAIGTLGFGVLVGQVLTNSVGITRGPMGLLGIHAVMVDRTAWYYTALALSLGVGGLLHAGERWSVLGVTLKAVRQDETSAAANGVNVLAIKLLAFCVSAFLAGLCGVLLAMYLRFLTPDLFLTDESFRYLLMAVVGGIGSVGGGWLAALLLTLVPEGLRLLGEGNMRLLVYGLLVLSVLWFLPGGIGSLFATRVVRRRPAAALPELPHPAGTAKATAP